MPALLSSLDQTLFRQLMMEISDSPEERPRLLTVEEAAKLLAVCSKHLRREFINKGLWLVSAADLATHLDEQKAEAERLYKLLNNQK